MVPRIPTRKRQRRPHRGDLYRSRELQSDPIDAPQFNSQLSPGNNSPSTLRRKFITRRYASQRSRQTSSNPLQQLEVAETPREPLYCVQVSQRQPSNPVSPRTPDPRLSSPLGNSLRTPTPNISRVRTSAPRPCPQLGQAMNTSPPFVKAPSSSEKTPSSPGLLSAQPSLLLLSLPRSSTPSSRRSVPPSISPAPVDVSKGDTPVPPKPRSRRLSFGASHTPGQQYIIDESDKPETPVSNVDEKSSPLQCSKRNSSFPRVPGSCGIRENDNPNCEHKKENPFRFRGSSVFTRNYVSPQMSVGDRQFEGRDVVVSVFQDSHMITPKSTSTTTDALEGYSFRPREIIDRQRSCVIVTNHEVGENMECEHEKYENESASTAPPSPILGMEWGAVQNDFENEVETDGVSSGVFCRPVEVFVPGGALRSPSLSDGSNADQ